MSPKIGEYSFKNALSFPSVSELYVLLPSIYFYDAHVQTFAHTAMAPSFCTLPSKVVGGFLPTCSS